MTPHRFHRNVPAGFSLLGLAAIVMTVSGCAVVDDVAHGKATATYSTAQDLEDERDTAAEWIPADARGIEVVSSTRAADAVSILFRSDEDLAGCTPTERRSAPTMVIDSGPDVYAIDEVLVCDGWAVAKSDGVFYGWTPAVEAEEG
jgi:hypothetical protein